MLPTHRTATHPGVILQEEFLAPISLSQRTFADYLGISVQRVNEIIKGKRGISAETAWLLADAFGTTPKFWTNLQSAHELSVHRPRAHVARLTPTAT